MAVPPAQRACSGTIGLDLFLWHTVECDVLEQWLKWGRHIRSPGPVARPIREREAVCARRQDRCGNLEERPGGTDLWTYRLWHGRASREDRLLFAADL